MKEYTTALGAHGWLQKAAFQDVKTTINFMEYFELGENATGLKIVATVLRKGK